MSKKKRQKARKKSAPSRTGKVVGRQKKKTGHKPWLRREIVTSDKDKLYQKVFKGLAALMLPVLLVLSLGSGINGDDEFQNDYSQKLVSFYTTMGADTSAYHVDKGNMHYYGGFFDLTTGLVNHALGFDEYDVAYHDIRHLFNAVFGWLIILFVGLLAKEIAGWRAGILAIVLMSLSPRFLGHCLMNPKDIPFAAGFSIALYYMVLMLKAMPKPKWQHALGLSLGITLALSTRAGGLLLIPYLFLFAGIDYLMKFGIKRLFANWKMLLTYLFYATGISLVAYGLAILSWPAALANPLKLPFEALTEFSKLGVQIRLLFMGQNILSNDAAWFYPLLWIAKTIPLYAFIGFIGSLFFLPQIFRRYHILPVLLVYFATIFPLSYVIYKDSLLHDGWRHLLFVYPSMIVVVCLFWITVEWLFRHNKVLRYFLWGVLALTILEAAVFTGRNIQYPYVYFNPIGGGIKGAFGNYETDYWGVGVKQALKWMEKEGIIGEDMQDTVTIGTNFYYNVNRPTFRKYHGKVRTRYVRFNRRYTENWDFGIFPSRFIRGPHLRSSHWPNSKTIHVIKANGVPIVAIVKQEEKHAFKGEQAIKAKDWELAIKEFKLELAAHPDNELAWLGLANAHLNSGSNSEAIKAVEESLGIAPDNENSLYFLGLAQVRIGDSVKALATFRQALAVNDKYAVAYYYIGLIHRQNKNLTEALENALQAIRTNKNFKAAYELAANIYEDQGESEQAARFREAAGKL